MSRARELAAKDISLTKGAHLTDPCGKKKKRRSQKSSRSDKRNLLQMETVYWSGFLSWVTECPNCPFFFFDPIVTPSLKNTKDKEIATVLCVSHDLSKGTNADEAPDGQLSERALLLKNCKAKLRERLFKEALDRIIALIKLVNYQVTEEELLLFIEVCEWSVRLRLQASCRITNKGLSHTIGFIKANIRRVSLTYENELTEEELHLEKEEFRSILLLLCDILQTLRALFVHHETETSESEGDFEYLDKAQPDVKEGESEEALLISRFNIYITFLSLILQSAFIEANFVSGNVFVNRLLNNVEEAYTLVAESTDPRVEFLLPTVAFMYGRLWRELSPDAHLAVDFLNDFYEQHSGKFEDLSRDPNFSSIHSTFVCNMRRIKHTIHHS